MAVSGFAQNPDIKRTMHWYFGLGAGLDFSSGTAVADTTGKSDGYEQCFAMSDTCGNLLFYAVSNIDGGKLILMDKNHQIMQNGILQSCCTVTQSACVPQPGNDSIFYVFYNEQAGTVLGHFFYAIVNINANGGLGAIISKDNILLDSLGTEKVAITQHCNGIDFWIASKMIGNWTPIGNLLFVWQLTASGLNLQPIISAPGNIYFEQGGGYFRFSPNGAMAAVSFIYQSNYFIQDSSYFEIYQFDNCTGIFSNAITIQYPQPYGLAFSPDNTKLYVGIADGATYGAIDTARLTQYDLTNYNYNDIINSKTILKEGTGIWHDFQIGLDGKIYVSDLDTNLPDLGLYKLGVINNPNALGLASNYIEDQLDLNGKRHGLGLPSFPDNYFKDFNYTNCTSSISENKFDRIVEVYPNPFNDFITINHKVSYQLKIIDLTGNIVIEKMITENLYQLNTVSLPKGIYILNISSKNKIDINQKIIKL